MVPVNHCNFINGEMCGSLSGETFPNINPHTGKEIALVSRSAKKDIDLAIDVARKAHEKWSEITVVSRGDFMRKIAMRMLQRRAEIAEIVALESGKAIPHALGETDAAIEMGFFIAGEGRRYYGKTTTASMVNRQVLTVRQPLGVAV